MHSAQCAMHVRRAIMNGKRKRPTKSDPKPDGAAVPTATAVDPSAPVGATVPVSGWQS